MERLKYPLLMVHGMGFRDNRVIGYWGRIPKALEKCGAEVFFGGQDSNGSVEGNAAQLKKTIEAVLRQTGAEKVNIIAHSKGGLEARYLISTMGMADKVASLTTISTPHNGSVTVDRLMDIVPQPLVKLGCGVTDLWFRILGDKSPDTYSAVNSFKTNSADIFNIKNPESHAVSTTVRHAKAVYAYANRNGGWQKRRRKLDRQARTGKGAVSVGSGRQKR